ncbi:MAG: FliO/MopB family protein [Alphaproteobacteria bacterium]|nr:FliO/MopB family protein [Alphaproteobacteria bacterium]
MSVVDYLRFLAALAFVLGLIGLLYWLARRYGIQRLNNMGMAGPRGGRLQIIESRAIDPRRRLVLIRRDSVEHLLLLGTDGDLVVESGIPSDSFQAAMNAEAAASPADTESM